MAVSFDLTLNASDQTLVRLAGQISDGEEKTLEAYLRECGELAQCRPIREGVPCKISVSGAVGEPISVAVELPTDDDLSILLHKLRPFILEKEPASYVRTRAVIVKHLSHPNVRAILGQQQELYDGRDFQRQVRFVLDQQILNCERVLRDWLNSYEYHRDRDKREVIASLFSTIPGDLFKGILVSLVIDKAKAVANLALFAGIMLGRAKEVRMTA